MDRELSMSINYLDEYWSACIAHQTTACSILWLTRTLTWPCWVLDKCHKHWSNNARIWDIASKSICQLSELNWYGDLMARRASATVLKSSGRAGSRATQKETGLCDLSSLRAQCLLLVMLLVIELHKRSLKFQCYWIQHRLPRSEQLTIQI